MTPALNYVLYAVTLSKRVKDAPEGRRQLAKELYQR